MAAIPSVALYVTADAVFVTSQQMTDNGRVFVQPMLRLDKNTSVDAVGAAVLRCLEEFEEIDGPPEPDHMQGLLKFVGAYAYGESHECRRDPQAIGEMLLQLGREHGS